MDKTSSPFFILSCERSGSTMLRYIVDTHSQIACPSHLYLGNFLEHLDRILESTLAQNLGLDDLSQKRFVLEEANKFIFNIMSRYMTAKGKQFWCEKTPMNLEHLSLLNTHFTDAKYICLYRHCMDVVHSSINLSKYHFLPEHIPYVHRHPDNIIAAMIENWLEKTKKLLAFESEHSKNSFRIKYESIVLRPEETLNRLFDFLGVGWEDGLVDRVFNSAHDKGEGDGKAALSSRIRQNSIGKGAEVPFSGIPDDLVNEINLVLDQLGYESLNHYYTNNDRTMSDSDKENMTCSSAISEVFEKRFKKAIDENRLFYPMLKGVWKLIISGEGNNIWYIDFSDPINTIKQDHSKTDYTLSFSSSLLFDMVNGRRDAIDAFIKGEIKVIGTKDKELLVSFGKLVFS